MNHSGDLKARIKERHDKAVLRTMGDGTTACLTQRLPKLLLERLHTRAQRQGMSCEQMVRMLLLMLAEGRVLIVTPNGKPVQLYGVSEARKDWLNEVSRSYSVAEGWHESANWGELEKSSEAAFLCCENKPEPLGLFA